MIAGLDQEGLRRLLREERLPAMLLDAGAFDRNVETLVAVARAAGKTIRIATKSIRSAPLLRRVARIGGPTVQGLLTYSATETAFLAGQGFDDLLLGYPTVQTADLEDLARVAALGRRVSAAVDSPEQIDALGSAACGAPIGAVLDVDMSWRPLGGLLHVGVRRSPVRTAARAIELARRVRETAGVRLAGLLAYEAQIAGLADAGPLHRRVKRWSLPDVARRRREVVEALRSAGFALDLVNGGGTGSIHTTADEEVVTEVSVGSGFLCPHLFDHYDSLRLEPAAFFALRVDRVPDARHVTCHGGGYVASGQAGPDRLPVPVMPCGLDLLPFEGAGEVQTPLRVRRGARAPALGDPVIFRHAKSGELAEHFARILLVSGGEVVERIPTYRGEGMS